MISSENNTSHSFNSSVNSAATITVTHHHNNHLNLNHNNNNNRITLIDSFGRTKTVDRCQIRLVDPPKQQSQQTVVTTNSDIDIVDNTTIDVHNSIGLAEQIKREDLSVIVQHHPDDSHESDLSSDKINPNTGQCFVQLSFYWFPKRIPRKQPPTLVF